MSNGSTPSLPAGLPFGWRGVGVVLAAVLLLSVFLEPTWVGHQPSLCVVRATTGVPCPGCGLTRSFVATAHGEFGSAFAFHPFGPLLFAACACALLLLGLRAVTGRTPLGRRALARLQPAAWAVLAVWLVWAGVRAVDHLL